MAKQAGKSGTKSLEDTLWEAADKLRNKIDPGEYKHVVLGLIFLKYVSDVFNRHRQLLETRFTDPKSEWHMPNTASQQAMLEDRDSYTAEGVFWIPEGHRWEDLRANAKQVDIGIRIDAAMDAIEKENPVLRGVLPKNYGSRELTLTTLGGLIDCFSREDLAAAEHENLDVLGRVFEYFLFKFASGGEAGEFYTPRGVVQLMVEMLEPFNGRVYDPAMGSGGMFVQADNFVKAHGGSRNDISVFGQEQNPTTWRLAKMNLALRGIEANLGPQWGDSFHEDLHPDLRADFILANPPFNISDWDGQLLRSDPRWKYGSPPVGNANFAWVQHMLHHLSPTGTMATVLANGSLSSNTSGEGEIRKNLIEANLVDCIIALPSQLFFTTPIPVCIWFLTKKKSNGGEFRVNSQGNRAEEVLFIDARELGEMISRKQKELTLQDIRKIADIYHSWRGELNLPKYQDVAGFCASVDVREIAQHDYSLTPGRYVGSPEVENDGEPIGEKIDRIRVEVAHGFERRAQLQERVTKVLQCLGSSDE